MGKTALIASGTSGIGLATARRFVDHGARVAITGRRDSGAEIAREISEFIAADLSRPDQIPGMVDAASESLGGSTPWSCHAGELAEFIPIEETGDDILDRMFTVNALGPYRVLRSALPRMRNGESVVFNATLLTRLVNADETAYGAAKSALVTLIRGAAMEWPQGDPGEPDQPGRHGGGDVAG